MHFIEEIEWVTKESGGESLILTHACYGFTFQPWNEPEMLVYRVLGEMIGGKFRYSAGTEEVFPVERADFQELIAANEEGKPHGGFNVRDIIAAFNGVRQKLAAPPKSTDS